LVTAYNTELGIKKVANPVHPIYDNTDYQVELQTNLKKVHKDEYLTRWEEMMFLYPDTEDIAEWEYEQER
jgi:hypothetical protein